MLNKSRDISGGGGRGGGKLYMGSEDADSGSGHCLSGQIVPLSHCAGEEGLFSVISNAGGVEVGKWVCFS